MKKNTQKVAHLFKGKIIEMLTILSVLMDLAQTHSTELIAYRPLWKSPFFDNLEKLIDSVIKKYVGVNNAAELSKATGILLNIQNTSLANLTILYGEINNFVLDKAKLKSLLITLGFDEYYIDATRNKSQPSTIYLLLRIQKNLTTDLQAELFALGVSNVLMGKVLSYGETMNNANINQELEKALKPSETAEAVNAYNDVYTQVMRVSKGAALYFKSVGKPEIQQQFSYNKLLKNMQPAKKPKTNKTPTQTPPTKGS